MFLIQIPFPFQREGENATKEMVSFLTETTGYFCPCEEMT